MTRLTDVRKTLEATVRDRDRLAAESASLAGDIVCLRSDLAAARATAVRLSGEKTALIESLSRADRELSEVKAARVALDGQLRSCRADVANLKEQNKICQMSLSEAESATSELRVKLALDGRSHKADISKASEDASRLRDENAALRASLSAAKLEIEAAKALPGQEVTIKRLKDELSSERSKASEMAKALPSQAAAIERLKNDLGSERSRASDAAAGLARCQSDLAASKDDIKAAQKEASTLKRKVKALSAKLQKSEDDAADRIGKLLEEAAQARKDAEDARLDTVAADAQAADLGKKLADAEKMNETIRKELRR